jgi:hypothetical protein
MHTIELLDVYCKYKKTECLRDTTKVLQAVTNSSSLQNCEHVSYSCSQSPLSEEEVEQIQNMAATSATHFTCSASAYPLAVSFFSYRTLIQSVLFRSHSLLVAVLLVLLPILFFHYFPFSFHIEGIEGL